MESNRNRKGPQRMLNPAVFLQIRKLRANVNVTCSKGDNTLVTFIVIYVFEFSSVVSLYVT